MSNRKGTMQDVQNESSASSQEHFNSIYTAHQVHTIANLIYRQLAAGWNAQSGWSQNDLGTGAQQSFPNAGWGTSPAGFQGMPTMHNAPAGFAAMPTPWAPPALFYWYP